MVTVNPEEVEFSYLHLIDNLTGNDVDLLATPSYSFEAKTTDYDLRFKLVFKACEGAGVWCLYKCLSIIEKNNYLCGKIIMSWAPTSTSAIPTPSKKQHGRIWKS